MKNTLKPWYVLVPTAHYHMTYGPFLSWDDAEAFAVEHGLVATHRPVALQDPSVRF
jgi:hypothetical protein